MVESLVQWTLINNPSQLSHYLNFDFTKIIGQEINTEFGRIDFILSNTSNQHLIVELETTLNSKLKIDYCFDQTLNYKNVKFTDNTNYCILYADETNLKHKKIIEKFGKDNNIFIQTYPLEEIKKLYSDTVQRLSLNVGLALPNPKNYTICFLRWLNKIMKPFVDLQKSILIFEEIFVPFANSKHSKTNFNCYLRLAFDFELIEKRGSKYVLTEYGKDFINNMNPYIFIDKNVSSIDLSNEQRRLLLKILTNGNWENKVHKVNIYWFLRFIEVTNGNWLPKGSKLDKDRLELAQGLFNVSYKEKTMCQFLNWCSNYCLELGLIEKIKSTSVYDQVFLTPLGVEVNNIFSMDLTLKKSRMNLSFKFLE